VHFPITAFSPAQCVGYIAFLVGSAAFFQKNDRHLKFLNASGCMAYAVHFLLLGNTPASASAAISGVRSFLALKTASRWVAALVIAVNVAFGAALVHGSTGWLPVIASCVATAAVFTLQGVPMRLALLTSTFLWLANNILCGSIGGTMAELTIATINTSTLIRMLWSSRVERPACGACPEPVVAGSDNVETGRGGRE
jgi:hypothetical protein